MGNGITAPNLSKRKHTAQNNAGVARSETRIKIFLKFLAKTGKVGQSARKAGYKTSVYMYTRRKADPEFAKAWDEALHAACDTFEDEAIRRGVEGVDKAVYYKGDIVGYEKVHSDVLLLAILKAYRPDRYRDDKSLNVSGTINHNVGIAVLPLTVPKLEDWETAALLVKDSQRLLASPLAEDVDDDGNVMKQPVTLRR